MSKWVNKKLERELIGITSSFDQSCNRKAREFFQKKPCIKLCIYIQLIKGKYSKFSRPTIFHAEKETYRMTGMSVP